MSAFPAEAAPFGQPTPFDCRATNARLENQFSDLVHSMQDLSLPRSAIGLPPQCGVMTHPTRQFPALGFPVQPQLAMYPILCQAQFQSGLPYVLDPGTQPNPVLPRAVHPFPLASAIYAPAPSSLLASGDYSQHRGMPSYGRPDARRQHAARISRAPYYNVSSHHNHVDVHRIREGIDVRTTASIPMSWQGQCSSLISTRLCCGTYPTRWTKQC
jgi:hypothetical protein